MRTFLEEIGNPQDRLQVIHVAGTSGKTSTAYFIRAMLQETGRVTGLTISPHIVSVAERIQVDGCPLRDQDFLLYLQRFLQLVESSDVSLTYFEVLVAFAYWVFAERNVDYAIVETGLGGLLDGTNTVNRADKVCVITDLGLDHTEVLGETIEKIAHQKAGIIQVGNPVFLVDQDPTAMGVVLARAKEQGAETKVVPVGCSGAAADLPLFQRRNWALARSVVAFVLNRDGLPLLDVSALRRAILMQPPGRMEQYTLGDKTLILDGAHNPQKLAALRLSLVDAGVSSAALLASFVTAPDHKLNAALAELVPLTSHLIIPNFTVLQDLAKQSPPAEKMAARARHAGLRSVEVREDLNDAFSVLLNRPEAVLLVTGSLYLVSQVRALAERQLR